MAYPSNIYISPSAKFFGFVDSKKAFNPHWDITWSFSFALTGVEHGFCTFLTSSPSISSAVPGHYLGYLGNYPYLLTEYGDYILSEDGERLTYEASVSGYDVSGILAIAFDSTGYFALSDSDNSGVSKANTNRNSLIIRNNNRLVFNKPLSSIDTSFFLASSTKSFQTIRCRLASGHKLYVDYKTSNQSYKNLATVILSSFYPDEYDYLYPAFTFSSPMSSVSITPSTLWLKNFHTQGNSDDPSYEVLDFSPLITNDGLSYTTIPTISANIP